MYNAWQDALNHCNLFRGIPKDELTAMLGCLRPGVQRFAKKAVIALSGDDFTGIGIVLNGQISVTKEDAAGNAVLVATLETGELFGDLVAFSPRKKWPATVTAETETAVMFWPPQSLTGNCPRMCESHRHLIRNMLGIISEKALLLSRKIDYLIIPSLRGKVSFFLLEQAGRAGKNDFTVPLKRDALAGFLAVSRPSLSRELSRMRTEGLIDFYRSEFRLKDIKALRDGSAGTVFPD